MGWGDSFTVRSLPIVLHLLIHVCFSSFGKCWHVLYHVHVWLLIGLMCDSAARSTLWSRDPMCPCLSNSVHMTFLVSLRLYCVMSLWVWYSIWEQILLLARDLYIEGVEDHWISVPQNIASAGRSWAYFSYLKHHITPTGRGSHAVAHKCLLGIFRSLPKYMLLGVNVSGAAEMPALHQFSWLSILKLAIYRTQTIRCYRLDTITTWSSFWS